MTAKRKIANAKHGSRTSRNTENALMPLNHNQQKQFNMVCARIARGESLRSACKDKDLPDRDTINRWLNADNDGALCGQYARAREEQADFYADEIVTIADTEPDAAIARVRIDARKWVASKLRPKRYGDKLALGGADDLPAIRQEVQERADAFTDALAGMVAKTGAGKGETRH